jgi:hypothetical protein
MDRHQLEAYKLQRNPASGDLLLLAKGATAYKSILSRAFPQAYFSKTFPDRYGTYSWGTYIRGLEAQEEAPLNEFCKLLQRLVCIEDDLDECFALSFHKQLSAQGGLERTPIGQLVREAKPYDRAWNPGSRQKADELARMMAEIVQQHPTYRRASLIASVPPSNSDKDFDLPAYLAERIAQATGQTLASGSIQKVRRTRPMKECHTVQEKIDNLKDAFAIGATNFGGKGVVLIDDIYQTGFSINEVGRVLHAAGAGLVLGLVATKTFQDLTEDRDP